jgi:hypothetical protein
MSRTSHKVKVENAGKSQHIPAAAKEPIPSWYLLNTRNKNAKRNVIVLRDKSNVYLRRSLPTQVSTKVFWQISDIILMKIQEAPHTLYHTGIEHSETIDWKSTLLSAIHTSIPSLSFQTHTQLSFYLRKLTRRSNHNWSSGSTTLRTNRFNCLDYIHTLGDGTKDTVFAIEPGSFVGAEEELKNIIVMRWTTSVKE